MSKKLYFLISFVLVVTLVCPSSAAELVGDFEQDLDGWVPDRDPVTLEMMTRSTTGATLRDYSLRFDAPGGIYWAIQRPLHTEPWKATNNNHVAFNVTWIDSEWIASGSTYGQIDKLVFGGEIGWEELTQLKNLVSGNPSFSPGAGDVTERLVWDYSGIDFSSLPAEPSDFYFTITAQSDNGGPFYFDNFVFFDAALANEPIPANPQTQVDLDTNLAWTAGTSATQHDIYFGTSFADVNNADNSGAPGPTEVYRARQSLGLEAYTIPETLQIGKTYYWRVDEYDGGQWLKGDVWSFTTKVAEARAPYPADGATDVPQPVVLSWFAGVDANSHDVYFGTAFGDVNDATTSSTEYEVNQPVADTNYDPGSLIWNKTYFWRIDEVNDPNTWKGDVWSFTVAPAISSSPSPSSSSSDVSPFVVLSWTPGAEAVTHEVYFSTYFNDVNNRNPSVLTVRGPNNYDPCGVLEFSTLYYWAVDEFNAAADPNRWLGEVWSFTTADHFIVDNFDLYADTTALGAVWTVDHLTNNGAVLFLETSDPNFVRDGRSMKFTYMNYKIANKYRGSETVADASALVAGTDWTANGVKAMVLYFSGDPCNGTDHQSGYVYPITNDQMYVAVEDGSANEGVVKYDKEHNYDMNDIKEAEWHEWNIDLEDPCLIAVDMNNVTNIYIGFGGLKTGQSADGAGYVSGKGDTVWFDDIFLFAPRCRSELVAADFDGDCFAGYEDLDMMAGEWLETDVNIVLSVSPPNAPVLWYKFEETEGTIVKDEMGDFNGTVVNLGEDTWDTTGGRDSSGCINLAAGSSTYVDVSPNSLDFVATTNKITFATWINGDRDNPQSWGSLFGIRATGGDPPEDGEEVLEVHCPTPLPPDFEFGPMVEWRVVGSAFCQTETLKAMDFAGRWNHYAFTKDADANTMSIYHNGQLLVEVNDANAALDPMFETPVGMFYIGTRHIYWGYHIGKIDDFQVYDYVLSPAEVAYLATDGTGGLFIPLETPTNIYDVAPNIINFKDFVKFAENWLEEKLWP